MNTQRSETLAQSFLAKGHPLKRKTQTATQTFDFPPEVVFPQLCPTAERDWIPGWECDLLYTSTGYMEPDSIWTTPETNVLGPGLWVVTRCKPNAELEIVRVVDRSFVEHMRIKLVDNHDGTATGVWNLTFTALDEAGNDVVASLPDESPELAHAIAGLRHFLATGELMGT